MIGAGSKQFGIGRQHDVRDRASGGQSDDDDLVRIKTSDPTTRSIISRIDRASPAWRRIAWFEPVETQVGVRPLLLRTQGGVHACRTTTSGVLGARMAGR
jgi:hypothetical protein